MMTDSIKNEMWNLIILHKSMYIIAFVKKNEIANLIYPELLLLWLMETLS